VALAIDASTPAKVTGTTAAIVTSSFSPPAASMLVAFVARNGPASNNDDGTVSSTGGLTWALAGRKSKTVTSTGGAGTEACAEIWVAYAATAPGSITVTDTRADAATGSDRQHILKPVVVTGDEVTWAGAIAAAFSASGLPSVSLSTTQPSSWVLGVSSDWSAAGLGTVGSGQTMIDEDNVVGQYSAHIWRQTSTTPASGTSVTMNLTAPSAEQFNQLAIELREQLSTSAAPSAPGRPTHPRSRPVPVGALHHASAGIHGGGDKHGPRRSGHRHGRSVRRHRRGRRLGHQPGRHRRRAGPDSVRRRAG
jgi:hypothetical protein